MRARSRTAVRLPSVARPLRILAILPTLNHYGGVISVLNMLEEFTELGHYCALATLSKYAKRELITRFEPVWLADRSRAVEWLGHEVYDFVIATSWETVDVTLALARATGGVPIYFVQDIESDFIEDDPVRKARAQRTYEQIETKVVKTEHLRQRLRAIGADARVIRPGMNLDIFYPRKIARADEFRVLAMARPRAPNGQRGFPALVEVFATLCARHADIRVGFFGSEDLKTFNLPFPYQDFGVVGSKDLAPIYSWADVYVDASRFHGFGRTGVEAMACGTVVVLSDSGGPRDYCVNEVNGLLTPVDDPEALVSAVERLKGAPELRAALRAKGLETVQRFDDRIAAQEFLAACIAAAQG